MNYTTTEREGMNWCMHYKKFTLPIGGNLKFFMDHLVLKYLVNNPVLVGSICRWLLLFQEFDFKVIVKLENMNVGQNQFSRIQT
jgi:hypothetical protein